MEHFDWSILTSVYQYFLYVDSFSWCLLMLVKHVYFLIHHIICKQPLIPAGGLSNKPMRLIKTLHFVCTALCFLAQHFWGYCFAIQLLPSGSEGERGGCKSLTAPPELLKQREGGLVYRCEAEKQSMNYKCMLCVEQEASQAINCHWCRWMDCYLSSVPLLLQAVRLHLSIISWFTLLRWLWSLVYFNPYCRKPDMLTTELSLIYTWKEDPRHICNGSRLMIGI